MQQPNIPTELFLVTGESGQYEDHYTWVVCAFRTQAAATAKANALNDEVQKLITHYGSWQAVPSRVKTRFDSWAHDIDVPDYGALWYGPIPFVDA